MGPARRLDGDHGEVALQRRLGHPLPRAQARLSRRGAGQLHRAPEGGE